LSAATYLVHVGRIRGLTTRTATARGGELLARLALSGGSEAPLRTLSKGNAQKVALAQALLVPPDLLVLDEPWSGLDASAHGVLAEIITEVAARGGAVVFTDHRESVTRAHATHTYLVRDGRVSPVDAEASTIIVLTTRDRGPALTTIDWSKTAGVRSVSERGGDVVVRVHRKHSDALLATALHAGWSVTEVTHDGGSTS
jgi:ABC-type multidrug transport system ATPase subunit